MIQWSRRKYTEEEFRQAWAASNSIAECARLLGLVIYGATYSTLKDTAKELGLTRDHMDGQAWNRGKKITINPPRPLEELLKNSDKKISSHTLKLRLIAAGIKKPECEICSIKEWLGKPAPLALDHIDGNHYNNELKNLRVLCYNCHGQTETFCKRKDSKKADGLTVEQRIAALDSLVEKPYQARRKINRATCCYCMQKCDYDVYWHSKYLKCIDCGNKTTRLRCRTCSQLALKNNKIEWPETMQLINMVKQSSFLAVGKSLGVSDNAVRKHLRLRGVDVKSIKAA